MKNDIDELLQRMSPEKLDALLRKLGTQFDEFANSLAIGSIPELAPPFTDYATFSGSLIEYYKQFFDKYLLYLSSISEQTWQFVNTSMQAFIRHEGGKDFEFNLRKEAEMLMKGIIESLNAYYNGSPGMAFKILEDIFLANESHLLHGLPQIEYKGPLYRVRSERGLLFPKDLFHIPFEYRARCGSYRFSILGYPSLYLSSSMETAINECRITDNNYTAICFMNDKPIRCIDLTLPNKALDFWERYCFVLFYPLIMACGLKVKEEQLPFKPEYVIPQLLFQIVCTHSDVMGVSYTTTRSEQPDYKNSKQRNFVLKVPQANKSKGYSQKLAEMFKCSLPISPEEYEAATDIEAKLDRTSYREVLR